MFPHDTRPQPRFESEQVEDDRPPPYDPFDYRIHDDPYPTFAWMRTHAPVYRNEERDFWALSRYADIADALRQPALFSSTYGISLEPELWGPDAVKTSFFLAMDPPEHLTYRGLIASAFTGRQVAKMEPRIRELTRARLAPLRDLSGFDFMADFAAALPNDVTCEMLGIPMVDWDQIRADTDQLNLHDDLSEDRSASAVTAGLRMADYFTGLIGDLRRNPGDDLTSDMIRAEVDGQKLSDSEIVAFLFLVVTGGNDSTGKTLGNAWYHGWLHPNVSAAGLTGRAADWAVETLRYDSASQMVARMLTEETTIHGTTLPAGARIAILQASANRDERVFTDPDRYDIDRDTAQLMSFGRGPHHCLGAALARVEMTIALEEIGALVADYEIDLQNTRRVHSPHQRGFVTLPFEITRRPRVMSEAWKR